MNVDDLKFGQIIIDGQEYSRDIVIDNGTISKRNKKVSKALKSGFGHTPLTIGENIPWDCNVLIIGTGQYKRLPIDKSVHEKASEKGVLLKEMSTTRAVDHINDPDTNLILHLTC